MLCNHEHQREVVHSEGGVEEFVRIDQEDDVLHRIFNEVRLRLFVLGSQSSPGCTIDTARTLETQENGETSLVIRRRLHDVSSQYRVDILLQVLPLKLDADLVAYLRNEFGRQRTLAGYNG